MPLIGDDNCRASRVEVELALASHGFTAGEFVIHEGWFAEMLSKPLGFGKVALLRLDCDWYRPTALCLKTFKGFFRATAGRLRWAQQAQITLRPEVEVGPG